MVNAAEVNKTNEKYTMATNKMPESYPGLVLLSQRCLNGATTHGADIPLILNTAARITTDRTAMLTAQATYQAGCGTAPAVGDALKAARAAAYEFGRAARNVLENYLGTKHSEAWRPTGFITNLAVPQKESGLVALITALRTYFVANPTRENATLNVTALQAETLLQNLTTTRQNFDALKGGCRTDRINRDAKVQAVRRRISGLVSELKQALSPLDPRWLDFGLNQPGAASVPKAPEDVTAVPTLPGQLEVSCDTSVTATSYRFYYQRPILDPEPIQAGSATDPLFIITGLVPGESYLVYASAANAGGESELSEPATAVVSAAAAA